MYHSQSAYCLSSNGFINAVSTLKVEVQVCGGEGWGMLFVGIHTTHLHRSLTLPQLIDILFLCFRLLMARGKSIPVFADYSETDSSYNSEDNFL